MTSCEPKFLLFSSELNWPCFVYTQSGVWINAVPPNSSSLFFLNCYTHLTCNTVIDDWLTTGWPLKISSIIIAKKALLIFMAILASVIKKLDWHYICIGSIFSDAHIPLLVPKNTYFWYPNIKFFCRQWNIVTNHSENFGITIDSDSQTVSRAFWQPINII